MKYSRFLSNRIIILIIVISFFYSFNYIYPTVQSAEVVVLTPRNSIEVTLRNNENASVYYTYYLNNSDNTIVYNCTFLFRWMVPEGTIIEKTESDLSNMSVSLGSVKTQEGTFYSGNVSQVMLEPRSFSYLRMALSIPKDKETTLVFTGNPYCESYTVRIIKTDGVNKLRIETTSPYPNRQEEDDNYLILIWETPTDILKDGSKIFAPIIRYDYFFDYLPTLIIILSYIATFGFGLFGDYIWDKIKRPSSKKTTDAKPEK